MQQNRCQKSARRPVSCAEAVMLHLLLLLDLATTRKTFLHARHMKTRKKKIIWHVSDAEIKAGAGESSFRPCFLLHLPVKSSPLIL